MNFTKEAVPHGGSLKVTIPPEIIRAYNIKEYDLLVLDLMQVKKK